MCFRTKNYVDDFYLCFLYMTDKHMTDKLAVSHFPGVRAEKLKKFTKTQDCLGRCIQYILNENKKSCVIVMYITNTLPPDTVGVEKNHTSIPIKIFNDEWISIEYTFLWLLYNSIKYSITCMPLMP